MKYGLMYYKATDNLGDDIQTYVAMKYLPTIDYYIDREALSCFIPERKESVSVIMNGWYIHNKIAWPPSPYINPLLISMHFKNQEKVDVGDLYLKANGGEYLKKFGPVGARDLETEKRLRKNGIPSYFSGCLTLTLEKFKNIKKKNKICLVDVSDEVAKKVKENTNKEIEILTHFLNSKNIKDKSINTRMKDVEKMLKKYQEAHLVITTRLHVALPCVALGTPVIVLHKAYFDKDRLGTFFGLFENYLEADFLKKDISDTLENPKSNSTKYLKIKNLLNKECENFIEESQEKKIDLPDIKKYQEYVNNINWYKDIYEKERLALENIELKRIKEFEIYHNELNRVSQENIRLLEEKNKLQYEVQEKERELWKIYSTKGWKYLEKVRFIVNGNRLYE